jgi:hypothetical protein
MREYLEYTDEVLCKALQRYFYHVHQQKQSVIIDDQAQKKVKQGNDPNSLRAMLRESRKQSKKLPIISGRFDRC